MPLTTEQHQKIWSLYHDENMTIKEVAEKVGCGKSTVSRWKDKDRSEVFETEDDEQTEPDDTPCSKGSGNSGSGSKQKGVELKDLKPTQQENTEDKDSEYQEIDFNDREQVKVVRRETSYSDTRTCQKFLKKLKEKGFSEIRMSDGDVR